uniref:Uncharacterized protein n=1 Tax=Anopheles merus TaxID=30066 RepID=A0A182UR08_ANOME
MHQLQMHGSTTGTMSHDRHQLRIASKRYDVSTHPAQRFPLILQAKVSTRRIITGRKEPERPQPVILPNGFVVCGVVEETRSHLLRQRFRWRLLEQDRQNGAKVTLQLAKQCRVLEDTERPDSTLVGHETGQLVNVTDELLAGDVPQCRDELFARQPVRTQHVHHHGGRTGECQRILGRYVPRHQGVAAHHDRPFEQSPAQRTDHVHVHGGGARTLAHDRDQLPVATEPLDVALHPAQGERLILQAEVARCGRIARRQEAEHTEPVLHGDQNRPPRVENVLWADNERAGRAGEETTAMDVHDHGQVETVFAAGDGRIGQQIVSLETHVTLVGRVVQLLVPGAVGERVLLEKPLLTAKRNSPTGGCANGMPRNASNCSPAIPSRTVPTRQPSSMQTRGASPASTSSADAQAVLGSRAARTSSGLPLLVHDTTQCITNSSNEGTIIV